MTPVGPAPGNGLVPPHQAAPDSGELTEFLQSLWPEGLIHPVTKRPAFLYVWHLAGKHSTWTFSLQDAARIVSARPENAYVHACLGAADFGPKARLSTKIADGRLAIAAPGVYLDLDVGEAGHKGSTYPSNVDAAMKLLDDAGLKASIFPPTITIHSGHGLQVWWAFKAPWWFSAANERDLDRESYASLLRRFQMLVKNEAGRQGLAVDSTFDVSRVLRPPATLNQKPGMPPVWARIDREHSRGRRYGIAELQELLDLNCVLDRAVPADNADRADDGTQQSGEGVAIVVNSRLDVPESERATLMAMPDFVRIWNLQKPTGKAVTADSFSERDLQMATFLACHAGFDAQRITDWLIVFRREKAAASHKRIKHPDYYRRTAAKGLCWAQQERERQERSRDLEERKAEDSRIADLAKKAADLDADGARQALREILGRDIAKMIFARTDNDPITIHLVVDDLSVRVGGEAVLDSRELTSRKVFFATGKPLPAIKQKTWQQVVLPMLRKIREEITLDADQGKIKRWLKSWFNDKNRALQAPGEAEWARLIREIKATHCDAVLQTYGGWILVLKAHVLAADVSIKEKSFNLDGEVRERLLALGFRRNREPTTIATVDGPVKLRDVFQGSVAAWWEDPIDPDDLAE